MGTRVHYAAKVKWNAVNLKLAPNYSNSDIMKSLGIRNNTQIQTWMRWYRKGETHRFDQPVGKQYTYHKGIED